MCGESRWSNVSTRPAAVGRLIAIDRLDGLAVARGENADRQPGACRTTFGEPVGDQLVGLQVDDVDFALRVLADLVDVALRAALGRVQRDDARVVVVRTVHRPRAQAEHQPHHAGRRIDALVPNVGIARRPTPATCG